MSFILEEFSPLWGEWYIKESIREDTDGIVYRIIKKSETKTEISSVKHIFVEKEKVSLVKEEKESFPKTSPLYRNSVDELVQKIIFCEKLKKYPHILTYEDHCVIPEENGNRKGYHVFIRTESLPNLREYSKEHRMTEQEVICMGIDICDGLKDFLFENEHTISCEITPENIFVDNNGTFKLGNFERLNSPVTDVSSVMNSRYSAPEIIQGNYNGTASILYSLGVVMYELLNNNTLPSTEDISVTPPHNCHNERLNNIIMTVCQPYSYSRFPNSTAMKNALSSVKTAVSKPKLKSAPDTVTTAPHRPDVNTKTERKQAVMETTTTPHKPNVNPRVEPPKPYKDMNKILIFVGVFIAVALTVLIVLLSANLLKDDDISVSHNISSENDDKPMADTTEEFLTQLSTQPPTVPPTVPPTEPPKISIASYKNASYDKVKTALENQGLIVSQVRQYSFEVEPGQIMEQSVKSGKTLTAGSEIVFTVSKGADFNNVPYDCEQMLYVQSSGTSATMRLYEYSADGWKKIFSCPATVGKNGVSSNYYEGGNTTPKGTFRLGTVLSEYRMAENMPWQPVSEKTVIVESTSSSKYNQIVNRSELPYGTEADDIGKRLVNGTDNASIFIEHNGNGYSQENVVRGRCSSITICGHMSAIKPTGGCIDISASDMSNLLMLLNQYKNPYIRTE